MNKREYVVFVRSELAMASRQSCHSFLSLHQLAEKLESRLALIAQARLNGEIKLLEQLHCPLCTYNTVPFCQERSESNLEGMKQAHGNG